jgi:hypothetical protein
MSYQPKSTDLSRLTTGAIVARNFGRGTTGIMT